MSLNSYYIYISCLIVSLCCIVENFLWPPFKITKYIFTYVNFLNESDDLKKILLFPIFSPSSYIWCVFKPPGIFNMLFLIKF